MDIRRQLHEQLDHTLGDDPRRALIAFRSLADDHLPWLEQRVVALARREGWDWGRIGRLLGRTRQSTREKFKDLRPATPIDRNAAHAKWQADTDRAIAAVRSLASFRRQDDGDVVPW
jgi:hypothetical protein